MAENKMIFFICHDCNETFAVFSVKRGKKKLCCPHCEDNAAVERMKQKKQKIRRYWTKTEVKVLIDLIGSHYNKEIGAILDRSELSVKRKIEQLRKAGIITEYRQMGGHWS